MHKSIAPSQQTHNLGLFPSICIFNYFLNIKNSKTASSEVVFRYFDKRIKPNIYLCASAQSHAFQQAFPNCRRSPENDNVGKIKKTYMKKILYFFGLCAVIIIIDWVITEIKFKQNCTGYLERAAYASTPEIAKNQLDMALMYLEKNKITHGSVSYTHLTLPTKA